MGQRNSIPPVSRRRTALGARRILVAASDPHEVASMERVLRRPSDNDVWDVSFASDGLTALGMLTRESYDVVIVDADLERGNGASLLRNVRSESPSSTRLFLCSASSLAIARDAIAHAHQVLPKPSGADLRFAVANALKIRALLTQPELRQLVGESNTLPCVPKVFVELSMALSRPNVGARAVAEIIERDMAVTAQVLRLVGSAFYGLKRGVTSLGGAVAYLGVETVKSIVLAVEVLERFPSAERARDFEEKQRLAARTAQLAGHILGGDSRDDVLFSAGLLRDVGQLVLASRAAQRFSIAVASSTTRRVPLYAIERQLFGATHAEIGAYLLSLWGVPARVAEAVEFHLEPWRCEARAFGPAGALYVAGLLLEDPEMPALDDVPPETLAVDLGYLKRVGVSHRLSSYRQLAQRERAASGAPPAVVRSSSSRLATPKSA